MKKNGIIIAGVLAVLCAVGFPQSAAAASNSLGVNPRRDYTLKSGGKISDTLDVSNLSKTDDLVIDIQVIDFGAKNETGSPQLLLGDQEPSRWSLKPYLSIAKNLKIPAGKSTSLPFTIAIPSKVGAGSYYGAIKYSTTGTPGKDNVSLTSSTATLIFLRVQGEANDALRLKSFGAFTPDKTGEKGTFGKLYVGSAPKYLAFRLQNIGNVAEQPTGSVVVKNIFGKQVKLFEKANPNNNIVLIDQTRRYDLCFNESQTSRKDTDTGRNIEETKCNGSKLTPGRYTARLAIVYGDNGSSSHELGQVTSFWYLPIWFIAVVAGGLLVVAIVVWLIARSLSKGRGYRSGIRR